jgi:hypothetical protein
MSCEEIITKLKLALGPLAKVAQISPSDCTIDMEKKEIHRILEQRGITAENLKWLWGRGSIYISEPEKKTFGDTVSPIERGEEKLKALEQLGCVGDPAGEASPLHKHPELGVVHVHHTCDLRKVNVDKLVKEWASV